MSNTENSILFFVGSYTMPAGHVKLGHGQGIYSCRLNLATGAIAQTQVTGGIDNPSYLARDPNNNLLYVASESFEGLSRVLSFKIGDEGALTEISNQPTHGGANCHVHCFGNRLFSPSYVNGNMDVYSTADGRLSPDQLIEYHGSGPNTGRQESAHAHQAMTSPDGKWLYVCDLGSDRIWRHRTDHIQVEPDGASVVPGGSGPRHLAFHPTLPFTYVACEMTARLLVCEYSPATGALEIIDDLATLPEDYRGLPSAAAIRVHPTGKALYFSNRQHNSVTTFSIDDKGSLELVSCQPSGGEEPRDINIDPTGNYLLIANQDGDNISVYKLDPTTGWPAGEILHTFVCKTPVSIEF